MTSHSSRHSGFTASWLSAQRIAGGLLALLIAASIPEYTLGQAPDLGATSANSATREPTPFSPANAVPSVGTMFVYTNGSSAPNRQGTAWVCDDGVLVTNYHVIEDAILCRFKSSDGRMFHCSGVLASSKDDDLALVSFENGSTLPSLPISDSLPALGEEVVAIGTPRGLEHSIAKGIVSSIRLSEDGHPGRNPIVQVTAPISPGSSGSPLLDKTGRVVGVITSSRVDGQLLNFAASTVSINELRPHAPVAFSSRALPGLAKLSPAQLHGSIVTLLEQHNPVSAESVLRDLLLKKDLVVTDRLWLLARLTQSLYERCDDVAAMHGAGFLYDGKPYRFQFFHDAPPPAFLHYELAQNASDAMSEAFALAGVRRVATTAQAGIGDDPRMIAEGDKQFNDWLRASLAEHQSASPNSAPLLDITKFKTEDVPLDDLQHLAPTVRLLLADVCWWRLHVLATVCASSYHESSAALHSKDTVFIDFAFLGIDHPALESMAPIQGRASASQRADDSNRRWRFVDPFLRIWSVGQALLEPDQASTTQSAEVLALRSAFTSGLIGTPPLGLLGAHPDASELMSSALSSSLGAPGDWAARYCIYFQLKKLEAERPRSPPGATLAPAPAGELEKWRTSSLRALRDSVQSLRVQYPKSVDVEILDLALRGTGPEVLADAQRLADDHRGYWRAQFVQFLKAIDSLKADLASVSPSPNVVPWLHEANEAATRLFILRPLDRKLQASLVQNVLGLVYATEPKSTLTKAKQDIRGQHVLQVASASADLWVLLYETAPDEAMSDLFAKIDPLTARRKSALFPPEPDSVVMEAVKEYCIALSSGSASSALSYLHENSGFELGDLADTLAVMNIEPPETMAVVRRGTFEAWVQATLQVTPKPGNESLPPRERMMADYRIDSLSYGGGRTVFKLRWDHAAWRICEISTGESASILLRWATDDFDRQWRSSTTTDAGTMLSFAALMESLGGGKPPGSLDDLYMAAIKRGELLRLTDGWDRPFRYVPQSPRTDGSIGPVIWSCGPDGIDQEGNGDDLVFLK